ncbi:MAG: mechanosensitive ion channel family protein [Acidimicrobiales bacterium]|jgi:small-conductance mechanosensitive channel
MKRARERDLVIGIVAGIIAVAALVVGRDFGNIHGPALNSKLVAWISAGALLVFGFIAARRIADGLGHLVTVRSIATAGTAVRLVAIAIAYIVVLVAVFEVLGLGVAIDHVLVGAGLAGVVLGIAAQQSLGNVFAALVLLLARPFKVGDHVRIRSGALGGVFDAWILEIGLVYVTVRTDDGVFKLPNSSILAAGVGQLPDVLAGPRTPKPDAGNAPDATKP